MTLDFFIVNISSFAGLKGVPFLSPHASSKHAVMGLTKSTDIEYATKGIRVNVVAPGHIKTDMHQDHATQGAITEEQFGSLVPMKKIGEMVDVANAIVFVSSEEVSFMTGAVFTIDGGLSVL